MASGKLPGPKLQVPGQIEIHYEYIPAPVAEASTVVMNLPSGVQVKSFGGFSKLESAAVQIAAGLAATEVRRDLPREEASGLLAKKAVGLAASVLAECLRAQMQRQDTPLAVLAEQAYTGYCQHTGFKSLASGDSLPKWDQLPPPIQAAWQAAVSHLVKG